MAEIDLVTVEDQDLFLRIGFLNLHGQDRFLDFSAQGLLGPEEEQLGKLLGERAASFLETSMDQVAQKRP